jgi:PAS domain S-box-containing protein
MTPDAENEPVQQGKASDSTATDAVKVQGWELTPSVLESLVTQSPVGMAIVDKDLRCVWSNAALEELGGGSVQQRLGRRLGEIQPGSDARILEAKMRQVLESGVPLIGYEHVGSVQSAPELRRALSLSFIRLDDDQGHPRGVCYTVTDMTARYRAQLRLALLDRAGRYIGRSLDVLQTAQELADVAVGDLADIVTVDLLDVVIKGGETSPGQLNQADIPTLRCSGHRSVGDGIPAVAITIGAAATYPSDSPPIQCLTSGVSVREARLDPLAREWASNTPADREERFADLGLHSAMVVPVRARGVTLGIATFFRRQRQEPFDDDALRLAAEFVDRAAVCIDNARCYTRERNEALTLQRSLLPPHVPKQQSVDVASDYRPANQLADVGGDWFDVIPLSGTRVGLVVGDVVGHGIDAAATMGRLRTAVQTLADLDLSPQELLARLDDLVGRDSREERAATLGTTCLYVVYDPVIRRCTMASAGHPPPAIISPGGTVDFPELPAGPALGVGGLPYESTERDLEEGSMIALFTDGLLASNNRLGAGRERLRRALERPGLSLDDLCRTTVDTLLPEQPADDVALLLVRTRGLSEEQVASWDVPSDPAAVANTRKAVAAQLEVWGLDELAFTTELVVSELITNAIRYASGPIKLRLIRDLSLICEVSDGTNTAPHLRHARTTDEGGRGLFLISQFAEGWGTRYTPDGKIIWAEQPLPDLE